MIRQAPSCRHTAFTVKLLISFEHGRWHAVTWVFLG